MSNETIAAKAAELFGIRREIEELSAVKAALAAMDSDAHRDTATAVCSFPVRLVLA